ncbi:PIN domain-containing protein [Notoacmeibacter sp. MSK16QG-6]|uniref:PIN domain-containing protein n=1 Tax=Notoacmeibacter sp. MSK16QG-6 TaxID=2957982 RepID=UPI00211177B3|nr:PIN domain-containing protein [Notoacmeibacter sp. MSK16QG-6]
MILADTSVWVHHFRYGNEYLLDLLNDNIIACHRNVVIELALGSLPDRNNTLAFFDGLPLLLEAELSELRQFIDTRRLFNRGIGLVDLSLLAACLINSGTVLWTRDRRLKDAAVECGVAFNLD